MTTGSENKFPLLRLLEDTLDSTPTPAGEVHLRCDEATKLLYLVDDAGTVTPIPGSTAADLDALIAASSGQDIADALAGAAAPDAANVFATMADVGGSSGSWTQIANESGASFANFTGINGTWSSNGTEIIQTNTATAPAGAKFNTPIPHGYGFIGEVEVFFPSSGQASPSLNYGCLLFAWPGVSASSAPCVIVDFGGDFVRIQLLAGSAMADYATTINLDTWYKLRAVLTGGLLSVYLDGTLKGTVALTLANASVATTIGLATYVAHAKFRNFKAWVRSADQPA